MSRIYPDLSENIEKDLTIMLSKIVHHLHPDIVKYITLKNKNYKTKFTSSMTSDLQASFFYEGSDCVFPGYRRPVNNETKKAKWKNNINDTDGTILNDNTIPRHIWAYLVDNRGYSGGSNGMWHKSGLDRFELAHIFGHKNNERENDKVFFKDLDETIPPYALFTSASNVVLIPKGFAKPTDHMLCVKRCFYKRHIELYGNNIVGLEKFDETLIPSWYKDLEWSEPILPINWEEKVDNLLKYREKHLNEKYKIIQSL